MHWEPKRAPKRNNGGQETMSCPWVQLYLQAFLHVLHTALCVCLKGNADCLLILLVLLRPLGHQTCRHGQGYGHRQGGVAGVLCCLCPGSWGPHVGICHFPCFHAPHLQKPLCPNQQLLSCSEVPVICSHCAASRAGDPNPGACFGGEGETERREMGEQGGCAGKGRRRLPLPLHGSVGIWTV